MDDQDLINLQRLVGRGPQPSPSDDDLPYPIQLAQALDAMGAGSPPSDHDPEQLRQTLADAVVNYGRQTPPIPDGPAFPSTTANTPRIQLASYVAPASGSDFASARRLPRDPGSQYAMGSPANVDLPWRQIADQHTTPTPNPAPPAAATAPQSSPSRRELLDAAAADEAKANRSERLGDHLSDSSENWDDDTESEYAKERAGESFTTALSVADGMGSILTYKQAEALRERARQERARAAKAPR